MLGSATDSFFAVFGLLVQLDSIGELSTLQKLNILIWISGQTRRLLQRIFMTKSPALQSFFESLFSNIYSESEWMRKQDPNFHATATHAFETLFHADKNRDLFRGRRVILLHVALKLETVPVVKALVSEEDVDVNTPLTGKISGFVVRCLVTANTAEMAEILLVAGAEVNTTGYKFNCMYGYKPYTALAGAVISNNTKLCQLLLKWGANPHPPCFCPDSHDRETLLCRAVKNSNIDLVNLLVERGADCMGPSDELCNWDIRYAACAGDREIVAVLLRTRSARKLLQQRNNAWGPMRDACGRGHLAIVELLIEAGAGLNVSIQVTKWKAINRMSWQTPILPSTPLLAATEGGHIDVIRVLIRNNVDVNAPGLSQHGTTAIEVAEYLGYRDIVEVLMKAGANKTCPEQVPYQEIEIGLAARRGNLARVQHLLDIGIHVSHLLDAFHFRDEQDYEQDWVEGRRARQHNILEIFLNFCGDRTNVRGPEFCFSALDLAIEVGDFELARQLILRGADLHRPDDNKPSGTLSIARGDHQSLCELCKHSGRPLPQQRSVA